MKVYSGPTFQEEGSACTITKRFALQSTQSHTGSTQECLVVEQCGWLCWSKFKEILLAVHFL